MSTLKNFKLRKLYQRKKNFILKNKIENPYLLLPDSNNLKDYLLEQLPHINYNYVPLYLQTTKIYTGSTIIKLIPTDFQTFVKKDDNIIKNCIALFYQNNWYPSYILRNIKHSEKNLLSILILLKELKVKSIKK